MKSFASIRLGSLGSLNIQHSISRDSDRPPGVARDAWIRLEENLGVVIAPPASSAAGAATPPSATGHMMVKQNGSWVRLILEPQTGPLSA